MKLTKLDIVAITQMIDDDVFRQNKMLTVEELKELVEQCALCHIKLNNTEVGVNGLEN